MIKTKDCSQEIVKFELPEQLIVKKISSILQFTAYDGFRISFDILSTLQHNNIDGLITYVEKRYREDIAQWVTVRLQVLKQFINGNIEIPTCLKDEGELTRRIGFNPS